ncbi:MAG: tRNA (5-methylaminomethyl-2-thiouridine)(34)-methyltransferase MnmD [Pseudomonadota bacterium]
MDPTVAPQLDWGKDGTPFATAFDDTYFSAEDGAAEARYVFLNGNNLPHRYRDGFAVAELGFGTGLNLLVAAQAWGSRAGRLRYTSFEAFPLLAADHRRALHRWPELREWAEVLISHRESGRTNFSLGPVDVSLVLGDARTTLPQWAGVADAWFLDGFSPARNPELWGEDLMSQIARHTRPGGSFATFTAAGGVRRALERAGFTVERRTGFGRKRHMSAGVLG